jgi:hypothetical protein
MFEVFHMDVAKVDQDVVYVSIVVHICCKLVFHLFFQTYVTSVFIWMLYMFHTYVVSVLSESCVCFTMVSSVFSGVFVSILDAYFKCFICLQTNVASVASLNVSKVDRMLHYPHRLLLPRLGVSSFQCWLGIRNIGVSGHRFLPVFSMLVTSRQRGPPREARDMECKRRCPSECPGASIAVSVFYSNSRRHATCHMLCPIIFSKNSVQTVEAKVQYNLRHKTLWITDANMFPFP